MSIQIYNALPGQQAIISLALTNTTGTRTNSITPPKILRVLLPSAAFATGYPQTMTQIDTGLYYFRFNIPFTATAVGNYLINLEYTDPMDGILKPDFWQVVVAPPQANFSISGN